ncbi:hypothetical protein L596_030260 [Steinernema carpocapsae]|uniref:Uncharacterized protein n=1 Tax=Steinernema carpocapsae TaxID=34508 RepID=A0A4U5LS77_STECR|nr:hypothetical protein L596_030260 [Steinernema carpocapsae]
MGLRPVRTEANLFWWHYYPMTPRGLWSSGFKKVLAPQALRHLAILKKSDLWIGIIGLDSIAGVVARVDVVFVLALLVFLIRFIKAVFSEFIELDSSRLCKNI